MDDSGLKNRESARHRVNVPAKLLDLFAIVILVFGLFSLPFPLVRQIWLQSVVGIFGFVNSALLLWMARRIRQLSYSAAFAGIGLVIHEQLLAWRGFLTLRQHNIVDQHDILFLAGNLIAELGLALIFLKCLKPLKEFSKNLSREFYMKNRKPLQEKTLFFQTNEFIRNLLSYGILILGLWAAHFLDLKWQFSACKIIAEFTCVISFYGIGKELELYFQGLQPKSILTIKIISHLLVMAGILWTIYRTMPIEPFLT